MKLRLPHLTPGKAQLGLPYDHRNRCRLCVKLDGVRCQNTAKLISGAQRGLEHRELRDPAPKPPPPSAQKRPEPTLRAAKSGSYPHLAPPTKTDLALPATAGVDIRPPRVKQFLTKQPVGSNPAVAPLPTTQLLAAQSNSGKGVLLSNLFLNPALYRGKFQRIFVFSHSMFTDWN